MDDLKPYPAYKDSGVPWLGDVPEHWSIQRIKTLFREKDERNGSGLATLLSLTRSRGILPQKEASKRVASVEDLSKYKVCRPGDLVMNRMQAWSGMFAVSPQDGLISPDYSIFVPIRVCEVGYFENLFKTPTLVEQFAQRSKGIGSGFNRLYTPDFGSIPVVVPPLEEQLAAVKYLNYVDRRVRRYIRARQKLIKLLEEQKQAIIHQAVTRGLDPHAPLKPSGIEWLGDIPAHWEVKPAKWYYREIDERSVTGNEELLSVSHITGVTPRSEKNITMFMAQSYVGHKICREGDLVINTMWAWMAALGVARQTGIVSPSYGVYRPISSDRFLPKFADLLLRTKPYISEYICRSTGIRSSRLRLYPEQFLRIPLICPSLMEQHEILNHITAETSKLTHSIEVTQREIVLIQEYRTRLIADVVTGKLDVRAIAASLPDETDEPDSLDEVDTLTDEDDLPDDTTPNEDDA